MLCYPLGGMAISSGNTDREVTHRPAATWTIPPARGWHHKTTRLFWKPLVWPLISAGIALLGLTLVDYVQVTPLQHALAKLALLGIAATVIVTTLYGIQRRLHEPLVHLRNWALRMRSGDLSARIPPPATGEFGLLAADINKLSSELQALAHDMDREVRQQTARLGQKNQSLEILYDVAASLNAAHDLDDLLKRFLSTLMKVVSARAASVKLLTPDGYMRLVASVGLDKEVVEREQLMPTDCCLCGQALTSGELRHQKDLHCCNQQTGYEFFAGETLEMLVVPLQYRDQTLGVYNLFTATPNLSQREDISELLISIGRHLGMAIEKTRLDTEAQRLAIMQERTMFAHELHDSLAQSLASLRIQVQMLSETLQQTNHLPAQREIKKIKSGMDDAYRELRQLLVHCRAPMDERGLVPAIEKMVEQFHANTGIAIFLHKECREFELPPDYEVQILHIVQESLTNVRKYSQARNVRVLLKCDQDRHYEVLVEDDGLGIVRNEAASAPSLPGEHIGMTVMQERAKRIGGTLSVESESGEGTRVLLTFRFSPPHTMHA